MLSLCLCGWTHTVQECLVVGMGNAEAWGIDESGAAAGATLQLFPQNTLEERLSMCNLRGQLAV